MSQGTRRRKWSKKKIVQEIRRLHEEGKGLNHSTMTKVFRPLYLVGVKYFGSWRRAVEAAGIDYDHVKHMRPRKWSKERIVHEIRRVHEAGEKLNCSVISKSHMALYAAGTRYFGSWRQAVQAAGLGYDRFPRRGRQRVWSREKIADEIRKLHERGKWLNYSAVMENHSSLHAVAVKYFGGWRQAIEAAGLEYSQIPRKPRRKKWNRERIIEEIRKYHRWRGKLNYTMVDRSLYVAGEIYFGSWKSAVKAAGFDPEQVL